MISAWQQREVSNWVDIVIKVLGVQQDILKCVQEFHCQHFSPEKISTKGLLAPGFLTP